MKKIIGLILGLTVAAPLASANSILDLITTATDAHRFTQIKPT